MIGKGLLMKLYWVIITSLAFFTLSTFADSKNQYIGVMTEFKFDPKKIKSLPFESCSGEENSSCAVIEKIDNDGAFFKSKKRCTFKVSGQNVSQLEINEPRTLKVKEVSRNSSDEVTSVLLEGAKAPIHFSCESEYSQGTSINRMPNFPLRVEALKDFKEFELGTINYDSQQEKKSDTPQKNQVEKKKSGAAI